ANRGDANFAADEDERSRSPVFRSGERKWTISELGQSGNTDGRLAGASEENRRRKGRAGRRVSSRSRAFAAVQRYDGEGGAVLQVIVVQRVVEPGAVL